MSIEIADVPFPVNGVLAFYNTQPASFSELPEQWQPAIFKMYQTAYINSGWAESFDPSKGTRNWLILQRGEHIIGSIIIRPVHKPEEYFKPWQNDPEQNIYHLNKFVLKPQCRGQGLGAKLFEAAIEISLKLGGTLIVADSRHANTLHIWENLGGSIHQPDITLVNYYLDLSNNLKYFREFTHNPFWKQWKFPEGIRMFMPKDDFCPSGK